MPPCEAHVKAAIPIDAYSSNLEVCLIRQENDKTACQS